MKIRDQHVWATNRNEHAVVTKQFSVGLLDFVADNFIQFGKRQWVSIHEGKQVYESEQLVELFEETL